MFTADAPLREATRTAHLTPAHEETVKATLPVVGAHIGEIAHTFYKGMFSAHPELLRDTFNRGNQRSGEQQKALAASVATFATMLVTPDGPDPVAMLSRIAHKHVSLGIAPEQYEIVHHHLFAAIAEVLGDAVTPEVAEAWDEVYQLMADVLITAERDLYATAGVEPGDVFVDAVLAARRDLTDVVTEFTFEVSDAPGAFAATKPGQYTSLGVRMVDGARQLRQYSLVNWDDRGFTVAVQRDGEVSSVLLDATAVGDRVDATLPAGDLVLADDDTTPVVLVSSGIGSTPMTGMLAALVTGAGARDVTVIHADVSAESYAQRAVTGGLCEALVSQGSTVRRHSSWTGAGERVTLVDLEIPAGAHWYLCGGNGFLQDIRDQLAAAPDLAPVEVHYEMFSPNDWLLGE
ncbi:globin domain-containing protein [Corynebacterium terpenotabidum]|uniref:nitric oxide dioxygenase n=1 Tax=Corynebacterium terpenotabidum Y-11 TaxID=1200352 RepID=S4XEM3_9CORY|nr:globin domain-containing protein [Corynebacterium terpenotabidum]AGP30055.1 nitric oxide dioxygenase [Corynebacterium terpenotabidum Y-11]